jgi:PAS domain S-box-containing protein
MNTGPGRSNSRETGTSRHLAAIVGGAKAPDRSEVREEGVPRWKILFEYSLNAIIVTNDERRIVDANPAACALFGRPHHDLLGRRPAELSAPGQDADAAWQAFRATGGAERSWRYSRADGAIVDVEFRAFANFLPGRHLVMLRDVSELRQAQRMPGERHAADPAGARRANEEESRSLPCRILILEDTPMDAELIEHEVRRSGIEFTARHVQTQEAFLEALYRFRPDVVLSDFSLPGFDALHALRLLLARSPDTPFIIVTGSLTQDAAMECMQAGATDYLLKDQLARLGPSLLGALQKKRLAEAHRRAEDELREAQQKLQHVVSSSPSVLFSLRPEGRELSATWISPNVEQVLGFSVHEALSPGWWHDNVHPDDREHVFGELPQLFLEDYLAQEYRFATRAGGYRWMRAELRLLRDAGGAPTEVIGSWSDVSDRKDAELLLAESEQQYRLLFHSNPHPMWVYNEDTLQFLAVNEAAIRSYGYSLAEFLGMTILDVRPPERPPASEGGEAGSPAGGPGTGSWTHRKKDGSLIQVEVTSSPITFAGRGARLALVSDVTEKKSLAAQLNQAQRMESVGRLAGGVAHDFNNLLGVISGYGELLRRRLQEPRLKKYSEDILQASERAAGLTHQLLAFSRQQVLQPQVLDLNAIVADVEKMLQRLIGEDVALRTSLAPGLGRVRADRGQLEQVLMNLAVNARDAMPKGGVITLETAPAELDAAYARTHEGVAPGGYAMLAVSDTGHGMSADVQARIFEPFFTTKTEGKGTGLGLATVYGIVKQSGGHIFVYSEPGHGATFKVYLPLVEGVSEAEAPAPIASLPRGSETILLVEDEASLRELVRECLEDCGYVVIEASHGQEALERAAAHAGPIQLLMTDVVMPGLGGRDLVERLATTHPDLKVLYMSGYTDDAVVHHGVLSQEMDFLQKPFTHEALAGKVRAVLDRPPGTSAPA